ncbi:hypothetical protein CYQ88_03680 [Hydrogenovibrio sp. SC-1]|uniref:hypothetical protein n=1 Tax=Hydrogenovibrio sp. SC-1 TaxID=2065820 RepID=UPI000C7C99E6|nr:hypothetical protein [Hydrogenovibrio sp. SC-1]PLA75010.1 hypothetical protein CYQ88_03680 [Hydrogenovibrio sp. SC-1]
MKNILITYLIILTLGIASMVTGIHYLANIAGFISAIGFMIIFFKDRPDEETVSAEVIHTENKMRRYWYIVFATGIFFSLIFGSFWNSEMGNMVS